MVAKLRETHINDTLSTQAMPVVLPRVPFPEPLIHTAIEARVKGEEDKIAEGLAAAPEAFLGLLKGRNFGKQLVKLI